MMPGLFDEQFLLRKLDEEGDPLARLNSIVDWKIFLPILENALGAKDFPLRDASPIRSCSCSKSSSSSPFTTCPTGESKDC